MRWSGPGTCLSFSASCLHALTEVPFRTLYSGHFKSRIYKMGSPTSTPCCSSSSSLPSSQSRTAEVTTSLAPSLGQSPFFFSRNFMPAHPFSLVAAQEAILWRYASGSNKMLRIRAWHASGPQRPSSSGVRSKTGWMKHLKG